MDNPTATVQATKPACNGGSPCTCLTDGPHCTPNQLTAYREAASELYASDEIEIDLTADISPSDYGAFVHAWVWVPRCDTKLCQEADCDAIVGDASDGFDGYCGYHADQRSDERE